MVTGEPVIFVGDTLLLATVVSAAVWDVRTRRIPNMLAVAGLVAALTLHAVQGGSALLGSAAGAGVALVLGFALFATGIIGAGDAKLLCAAAAFLGFSALPALLAFSALAGGLLALASAARQRVLLRVLGDSGRMMANVFSMGMIAAPTPGTARALTLPYAVAIAAGAVAARYL